MKLLIDINEELYKNVIEHTKEGYIGSDVWTAVAKGEPVSTEGDLISRKALKENINSLYEYDTTYNEEFDAGVQSILNFIDNAPTVETSKIEHKAYNEGFKDGVDQGIKLSERPQGEWIKTSLYGKTCYECNKCHLHYDFISNFCPNCGADMKGGTE